MATRGAFAMSKIVYVVIEEEQLMEVAKDRYDTQRAIHVTPVAEEGDPKSDMQNRAIALATFMLGRVSIIAKELGRKFIAPVQPTRAEREADPSLYFSAETSDKGPRLVIRFHRRGPDYPTMEAAKTVAYENIEKYKLAINDKLKEQSL